MKRSIWLVLLGAPAVASLATAATEIDYFEEMDRIDRINTGELVVFKAPPEDGILHQVSNNTLTAESLRTGWVKNSQCYFNLDGAVALQVVYRPGRVRKLRIARTEGIGKAWVEGDSVQLEDVQAKATLCVESENRALLPDEGMGVYAMHAGPFMRRFFDGYFPMRVTMTVNYPPELVSFAQASPGVDAGMLVSDSPGRMTYEAIFEGRLQVEFLFFARG
jgi:hypothetical protein